MHPRRRGLDSTVTGFTRASAAAPAATPPGADALHAAGRRPWPDLRRRTAPVEPRASRCPATSHEQPPLRPRTAHPRRGRPRPSSARRADQNHRRCPPLRAEAGRAHGVGRALWCPAASRWRRGNTSPRRAVGRRSSTRWRGRSRRSMHPPRHQFHEAALGRPSDALDHVRDRCSAGFGRGAVDVHEPGEVAVRLTVAAARAEVG